MSRVLKVADPDLARTVSRCALPCDRRSPPFRRGWLTFLLLPRATPLPFFALSWLLTLFAHDVDSEPVIQLVFDFLLAHNPIMAVYLTVAVRPFDFNPPSSLISATETSSIPPSPFCRSCCPKKRSLTSSGRASETTPACSTRLSQPSQPSSRARPLCLHPTGDARPR
jgi:hypothetical protein